MLKTRWRLSAHTASPVWCGLGPPRHRGDTVWRRQHRGVGTVQLVWYSQALLSLAENKKWLAQHLLQVRGKMSPTRRASAAQRGSPKNKKTTAPTQTKQSCLAHHIQLYTIHITLTSPLISNSSHSLHLNDNPKPVWTNFCDEATRPLAELKSFLLLRAGGRHNFLHRRGKLRVI